MRLYVTLQPAQDKPCGKTVYALPLPDNGDWGEVVVKPSKLEGFGVYPRNTSLVSWSALDVPVLMCAADSDARAMTTALIALRATTHATTMAPRSSCAHSRAARWLLQAVPGRRVRDARPPPAQHDAPSAAGRV